MKNFIKIFILATFIFSTFYYAQASSDLLYFSTNKQSINNADEFLLNIEIDSTSSVNTVAGQVHFNVDDLSLKEIREGSSVLNFWVEKPHLDKKGVIIFSGITPGGFSGKNNILTLVFKAQKQGDTRFYFSDVKILKNDGNGSILNIPAQSLSLSILEKNDNSSRVEELIDNEIPEVFTPILGQDEAIFDGKKFLVFETIDKSSGMDHFEVKEGFFGTFTKTESPYLLKNQSLLQKIYIKAIDKKGNERIVIFNPQNIIFIYKYYVLFAIILVLFIFYFFHKKLWQKLLK